MQTTFEARLRRQNVLHWLLLFLFVCVVYLGCSRAAVAQPQIGEVHASAAEVTIQSTSKFVDIISRRLRSNSMGDVGMYGAAVPMGVPVVQSNGPLGMPLLSDALGDDFVVRAQGIGAPGFGSGFGGASAFGPSPLQTQGHGWISGYALSGEVDGNAVARPYDYDSRGLIFGIDRHLLPNLLVGIVGGYTGTDLVIGSFPDRADIDSYHIGLYGHLTEGLFYSSGLISYGYQQYETSRQLVFPVPLPLTSAGDYGAHEFTTYVEKGMNLNWFGWRVQPLVGLQYNTFNRESFQETPLASLRVLQDNVNSLRLSVGGRIAPEPPPGVVGTITPEIRGRWVHEFLDDYQAISRISPFAGTGRAWSPKLGRNFGIVGAGINVRLSALATLFLDYDFQFSSQLESHAGTGGLEFLW